MTSRAVARGTAIFYAIGSMATGLVPMTTLHCCYHKLSRDQWKMAGTFLGGFVLPQTAVMGIAALVTGSLLPFNGIGLGIYTALNIAAGVGAYFAGKAIGDEDRHTTHALRGDVELGYGRLGF